MRIAKKIVLIITGVIIFTACKAQEDVSNITKTCIALKEKNIINYQMCTDWNLSTNSIVEIITHGHKEYLPEDVDFINFYGFFPDNIFIKADFVQENKIYDVLLGTESWFLMTEKGTEQSSLFSCRDTKLSQYFLGHYVTEKLLAQNPKLEDKYYKNRENTAIKIKNNLNVDHFVGHYSHEDFDIIIDQTNPSYSINNSQYTSLLFYREGDTLLVYQGYTQSINEKGVGDFLFKIFIKNNQYYFQSPSIHNGRDMKINKL